MDAELKHRLKLRRIRLTENKVINGRLRKIKRSVSDLKRELEAATPSMRNRALAARIRLTKNVNGKRIYKTNSELKRELDGPNTKETAVQAVGTNTNYNNNKRKRAIETVRRAVRRRGKRPVRLIVNQRKVKQFDEAAVARAIANRTNANRMVMMNMQKRNERMKNVLEKTLKKHMQKRNKRINVLEKRANKANKEKRRARWWSRFSITFSFLKQAFCPIYCAFIWWSHKSYYGYAYGEKLADDWALKWISYLSSMPAKTLSGMIGTYLYTFMPPMFATYAIGGIIFSASDLVYHTLFDLFRKAKQKTRPQSVLYDLFKYCKCSERFPNIVKVMNDSLKKMDSLLNSAGIPQLRFPNINIAAQVTMTGNNAPLMLPSARGSADRSTQPPLMPIAWTNQNTGQTVNPGPSTPVLDPRFARELRTNSQFANARGYGAQEYLNAQPYIPLTRGAMAALGGAGALMGGGFMRLR